LSPHISGEMNVKLRANFVKGVDGVVDIKPAELREPSRLGHGLRIAGWQPKCSKTSAAW
jgi:hypothetical protein